MTGEANDKERKGIVTGGTKGKGEESKEDWWVIDFTLEELKTLRVKQDNFKRPKL